MSKFIRGQRVWVAHVSLLPTPARPGRAEKPARVVIRERIFYRSLPHYLGRADTWFALGPLNGDESYCVAYRPESVYQTQGEAAEAAGKRIAAHVQACLNMPVIVEELKP
jgi:hypothetical protein